MTSFAEIWNFVVQCHENGATKEYIENYFRDQPSRDVCNKWKVHNASFTEFISTWRVKRQDTIAAPYIQPKHLDTCWAIALFRGQSALVRLNGSDRVLLTLLMLLDGVDPRYQSKSNGVDRLEDLISFMVEGNYVRRMIVHHRPRDFDQVRQDQFESLIENLLVKGPVVVAFDVFRSYEDNFVLASGQGIFSPTEAECQMRAYQRFSRHCVVLYGKGVEVKGPEVQAFWEALESRGQEFGDDGFVRLARGKGLIKEVVELKV